MAKVLIAFCLTSEIGDDNAGNSVRVSGQKRHREDEGDTIDVIICISHMDDQRNQKNERCNLYQPEQTYTIIDLLYPPFRIDYIYRIF